MTSAAGATVASREGKVLSLWLLCPEHWSDPSRGFLAGQRPGWHLQPDFARASAPVEGSAAWRSCSRAGPTPGASADPCLSPSHPCSAPPPLSRPTYSQPRQRGLLTLGRRRNSGTLIQILPPHFLPGLISVQVTSRSPSGSAHPSPRTLVWLCGPSKAMP